LPSLELKVPAEAAGERLDRFLSTLADVGSRAAAERLLAERRVRVNGSPETKSHRLAAGDKLDVELPERRTSSLEPEQLDLRIAYEDEHLLVVDKPAGMSVHPGAGEPRGTLAAQLLTLGAAGGADPDRPGVVHRLDRNTSGALVVARGEEVHAALQDAIRRRVVERRYLALVRGHPRSRTGRIDAPLGRDRRDPTRRSLDTDEPRDAVTHFELREAMPEHALLDVSLETGRTHQIRVHLAAIELPVSGDPQYGVKGDLGLERQFLHAYRLRFTHPVTGVRLDVSSPLPADLEGALDRARAAG